MEFFKGKTLDAINRTSCEAFGDFLHLREIDRARKLYNKQVAVYKEKLGAYRKNVQAREKFITSLAEQGINRALPSLRSKPPTPLPPFDPKAIER